MMKVPRNALMIAAWTTIGVIAFGTLAKVQLVYSVYFAVRPLLFGANIGTWGHIEHAAAFMMLGVLFGLAYPTRVVFQLGIVVGTAVGFELLQTLTPDRHATMMDASEKILSGALGVFIVVLFRVFRANANRTP